MPVGGFPHHQTNAEGGPKGFAMYSLTVSVNIRSTNHPDGDALGVFMNLMQLMFGFSIELSGWFFSNPNQFFWFKFLRLF